MNCNHDEESIINIACTKNFLVFELISTPFLYNCPIVDVNK